jgi:acyl-CoA dehydrogenase
MSDLQGDVPQRAVKVAEEVARPAADDVDASARFPTEAIDALRAAQLLSALVPTELGGLGASVTSVADATFALARECASTAMVFAMHHMQLACVLRHGHTDVFADFVRELVRDQLLLASATTEIGVGGDTRTSICAVERGDGRFSLQKQAPVISYGEEADAILATARRDPNSPPSDQVLVVCRARDVTLTPISGWDTLGFRGTCSLGFELRASGDEAMILTDPFADISTQTMLPIAHVLWSSVWLGLAATAVDKARRFVQARARKQPGVQQPAATRLAELVGLYQQMDALVRGAAARYDQCLHDREALSGITFAVTMNALKVSASTMVVDIVSKAMLICGIDGYRQDSPYSLGRVLRDAYGAAIMVNNDRIMANNAQLVLVAKDFV